MKMQEVLQGLHTLYLFSHLPWGLSPLFFIFSFSSLMPKMVPLVLQILIPNANRMCQVQGDVNGKLIEEQRVGLCYKMSSAWILKQKPATDLLPLKSPSTHGTQSWAAGTGGAHEFLSSLITDCSLGFVVPGSLEYGQDRARGLTQTRPQESHGARFCHPPPSKAISPSGKVRLPSAAKFLLTLSSQQWSKPIPDPCSELGAGAFGASCQLWQCKVHKVINEFYCFICFINCPQIMMLFKSLATVALWKNKFLQHFITSICNLRYFDKIHLMIE